MLTGLAAMGSDNFILKAISAPRFVARHPERAAASLQKFEG
jgi:hypothetical protein